MRILWNFGMLLCCFGASAYWASQYGGRSAWFCFYGSGLMLMYMNFGLLGMLLRPVTLRLTHEETRVFSGEPLELQGQLTVGRGLLPSGWLQLELTWVSDTGGEALQVRESLPPSRSGRVRLTLALHRLPRGFYRLEAAEVTAGDVFGLLHLRRRAAVRSHRLLILPKPLALRALPPGGEGEALPPRQTVLTPERQALSPYPFGTRPYTPGDPLNRIHWRATARTGALRAKETERPDDDRLLLCIDAAGSRSNAGAFETAVQAAAGLALRGLQQGCTVRLAANDRQGRSREARGREQLPQLLELLALLPCDGELPLAAHVQREARRMGQGSGIAIVTAQLDEPLLRLMWRLRSHAPHLVYIHAGGTLPDAAQAWRQQAEAAGAVFTAVSAAGRVPRTAERGEGDGRTSAAGA